MVLSLGMGLSNRVFQCIDDIVGHCCDAWNALIEQAWKIMSPSVGRIGFQGYRCPARC
jgi:hypothetical protein